MVRRAVCSALKQHSFDEVVVVDDHSAEKADFSDISDSRFSYYYCEENGGVSRARNIGIDKARSTHLMFLDDDDRLFPWAGWAMKRWLSTVPETEESRHIHIGTLISETKGQKPDRRTPPTSKPGEIWGLDKHVLKRGTHNFATKQAAAIPRKLLQDLGGWDVNMRTRETTELFYRLSREVAIIGHRLPIYRLNRDDHDKLTQDVELRKASHAYLLEKHADLLSDPARMQALEGNHEAMLNRIKDRA